MNDESSKCPWFKWNYYFALSGFEITIKPLIVRLHCLLGVCVMHRHCRWLDIDSNKVLKHRTTTTELSISSVNGRVYHNQPGREINGDEARSCFYLLLVAMLTTGTPRVLVGVKAHLSMVVSRRMLVGHGRNGSSFHLQTRREKETWIRLRCGVVDPWAHVVWQFSRAWFDQTIQI